jgi:hypothetical protein
MAEVTLWREELDGQPVPDVCVRCGRPAEHVTERTFYGPGSDPGTALVTGLLGALGGVLALLVRMNTARVRVPVCGRHRRFFPRRKLLILSAFVLPLSGFAGVLIGAALEPGPPKPGAPDTPGKVLVMASACVLVPGLFWALFVILTWRRWTIRAVYVNQDRVRLAGVSEEYAAAVRAAEPGDAAGPDRDDRRPWMK